MMLGLRFLNIGLSTTSRLRTNQMRNDMQFVEMVKSGLQCLRRRSAGQERTWWIPPEERCTSSYGESLARSASFGVCGPHRT